MSIDFVADEYSLLRLLKQERKIMAMSAGVLKEEHFSKHTHRWIFSKLWKSYKEYHELPSTNTLIKYLNKLDKRIRVFRWFGVSSRISKRPPRNV